MTTEGAGMTVGGRNGGSANTQKRESGDTSERWRQFVTSPPHLTSPLEGGRDELGKMGAGVWERAQEWGIVSTPWDSATRRVSCAR